LPPKGILKPKCNLALAHLERNTLDQAELMFRKTLELLPEPGRNQPYYNMFRWGAHTNLGRIYEARQNDRAAIAQLPRKQRAASSEQSRAAAMSA